MQQATGHTDTVRVKDARLIKISRNSDRADIGD